MRRQNRFDQISLEAPEAPQANFAQPEMNWMEFQPPPQMEQSNPYEGLGQMGATAVGKLGQKPGGLPPEATPIRKPGLNEFAAPSAIKGMGRFKPHQTGSILGALKGMF